MKNHPFVLQPFPGGVSNPPFSLTGAVSRVGTTVNITYHLAGPLQELSIAPAAREPARRWCLWETTCFEFFLAGRDAADYWEFNLSPAGHWNLFRLTDYRQGIQEEPAIQELPFTVNRQDEMLTLALEVDLAAIIPVDKPLEVAVSTVLQHVDGRLSYWALNHPGPEPDFHSREGFVIKMLAFP